MPHACATPSLVSQGAAVARPPDHGAPPRDPTHICEETNSTETLCYRPATNIEPATITHCHPTGKGKTCGTCQDNCHHAHSNLPW
jgi:hypothetical protein